MVFKLISLLFLASSGNAFKLVGLTWGRCPVVILVQQSFDISKYQGEWYEQAGYNTMTLERHMRCPSLTATLNQTDGVLHIEERGIFKLNNKLATVKEEVKNEEPGKNEGRMILTFPTRRYAFSREYLVLGTDYDTYAVAYSCKNQLDFFYDYKIWLLSRQRKFTSPEEEQSFFNTTSTILLNHNLDSSVVVRSSQDNCHVSIN